MEMRCPGWPQRGAVLGAVQRENRVTWGCCRLLRCRLAAAEQEVREGRIHAEGRFLVS